MSSEPPRSPQEPATGQDARSDPAHQVFWRSRAWWGKAAQTSLGVWGSNVLSFFGTVILARALGPEEYGTVLIPLAIVALVSTFLDVTLEEATVFHGNRALASGDVAGLRALVRTSLTLDIAIGVAVAGAIVALAAPLATVSADPLDPDLVRLAALSALVTTADSTASAVLLVANRVHLRAWNMTVTSLFRLVGFVIAVQAGGGAEAAILAYALGGAAGSLVLVVMAWWVGWRQWDPGEVIGSRPVGIWVLVRFAFHSSVATSVYAVYGSLVPLLLATTAGAAAVAIFTVAMLPVIAAKTLAGPLRLAMFPEQARLVVQGRVEELRRSVKGWTSIGLGAGLVASAIGFVAMPWLIGFVYSDSYDDAVTPARILLLAAVFYFAFSWTKTFPAAIGRPQMRTMLALVELAVLAPLLLLLGDRGAEGGAIAVSAGAVTVGVISLFLARRLLSDEALVAAKPTPPPTAA